MKGLQHRVAEGLEPNPVVIGCEAGYSVDWLSHGWHMETNKQSLFVWEEARTLGEHQDPGGRQVQSPFLRWGLALQ